LACAGAALDASSTATPAFALAETLLLPAQALRSNNETAAMAELPRREVGTIPKR
jgi:hypothetical protein